MPIFAIGDIHGNLAALNDLLGQIEPRLGDDDTVVFLGDYIDRGPDSRGCIERILKLRSTTPADVVTLVGNHEDWFLRTLADPTRHSWILGMDAFPTIASYSTAAVRRLREAIEELGPRVVLEHPPLPYEVFFEEMPGTHRAFLEELKPYWRADGTVLVHGGLDPSRGPLEEQKREDLLWGMEESPASHEGPELVVYGHWSDAVVDDGGWPRPRQSRFAIGLDTISHGVLSAAVLPEREIVQSARHDV